MAYFMEEGEKAVMVLIAATEAKEKDNASLSAAKANRWNVVSMKQDWKIIFCPP